MLNLNQSKGYSNGGSIGLIRNGDIITLDINKNLIEVKLSDEEIEKRRQDWKKPVEKPATGVLKKFRNSVASASQGCVTD